MRISPTRVGLEVHSDDKRAQVGLARVQQHAHLYSRIPWNRAPKNIIWAQDIFSIALGGDGGCCVARDKFDYHFRKNSY